MTESKDRKTGIIRHEYSTVSPAECKRYVNELDCIKQQYHGNRVSRYIIDFNGSMIEVRLSPTRAVLFGTNALAMLEVAKLMNYEKWEYDNTTPRTDYMGAKQ